MAEFADLKYVQTIRQALWTGREIGRAAIMVGAGFSLNSDAAIANPRKMSLWEDLVRALVADLYPSPDFTDDDRNGIVTRSAATSGALRLAEEYESAFGRQQLDQLLIRIIPDLPDYRPGRLHRLLLQLPWADILTTNYDTLLERTTSDIVQRRYDVVRTQEEIPRATRPRIVKLHGSFPGHTPFILTEEDYRTYPTRFAPFVNLAKQAIMETVFCLIGFSGNDPNFLFWSGWVRDQLGSASPPIYLCGLLNLSDAQRRLLYRRNVTPIDLSPMFPPAIYPNSDVRELLSKVVDSREKKGGVLWEKPQRFSHRPTRPRSTPPWSFLQANSELCHCRPARMSSPISFATVPSSC